MSESGVPESPSRLGEGGEATDSVEDRHGGEIEEPHPAKGSTDPAPDSEQEENAETSLDQPSS